MSPKGETWGTRAFWVGRRCGPPAGQEGVPQGAIGCCKSNVLVTVPRRGRKIGLRRLAGQDICYAAFNKAQPILSPLRRGTPAPPPTPPPAPDPEGAPVPGAPVPGRALSKLLRNAGLRYPPLAAKTKTPGPEGSPMGHPFLGAWEGLKSNRRSFGFAMLRSG